MKIFIKSTEKNNKAKFKKKQLTVLNQMISNVLKIIRLKKTILDKSTKKSNRNLFWSMRCPI